MEENSTRKDGETLPTTDLEATISEYIIHCQGEIDFLSGNSHILEHLDPSIRKDLIELSKQELAEFQALDPQTTSEEEIQAIARSYRDQSNALNPKHTETE